MKIQTKNILEFKNRTRFIKPNNILSVLGYVLLQVKDNTCYLTKSNMDTFCRHSFPFEHENTSMLLEEKILFNIAPISDEIDILQSGTVVTIKGRTKQSFDIGGNTIHDFPQFPEYDETQPVTLTKEVLQSIGIASKYSNDKDLVWKYTYSTDNDVMGTDGYIAYHKQFSDVAKLAIGIDCAQIISGYESLLHFHNESWNFFDTGNTLYGFKKSDQKPRDYSWVKTLSKANGMKVLKSELELFCDTTIGLGGSLAHAAIMSVAENKIRLYYNDPDYSVTNELFIEAENLTDFGEFKFNAPQMLKSLRPIPYDILRISTDGRKLIIWSDEDKDFTGLLMGML